MTFLLLKDGLSLLDMMNMRHRVFALLTESIIMATICPENCRWTTYKVQSNNRRNNRVLVCDGESHTLQEWAELLGIQDCILRDRIFKLGWDEETALKTPVRHCKRTKYRTVIQSADISRP